MYEHAESLTDRGPACCFLQPITARGADVENISLVVDAAASAAADGMYMSVYIKLKGRRGVRNGSNRYQEYELRWTVPRRERGREMVGFIGLKA